MFLSYRNIKKGTPYTASAMIPPVKIIKLRWNALHPHAQASSSSQACSHTHSLYFSSHTHTCSSFSEARFCASACTFSLPVHWRLASLLSWRPWLCSWRTGRAGTWLFSCVWACVCVRQWEWVTVIQPQLRLWAFPPWRLCLKAKIFLQCRQKWPEHLQRYVSAANWVDVWSYCPQPTSASHELKN